MKSSKIGVVKSQNAFRSWVGAHMHLRELLGIEWGTLQLLEHTSESNGGLSHF